MNLDRLNNAITHHRERAEFLEKLKSDIEKCKSQNELAVLRGMTRQNSSLLCIKYRIVFHGERIKHKREILMAQLGDKDLTTREAAEIWG